MNKIAQTKSGSPGGNCFQACLASVFELSLDEVPDFMNLYGDPADPDGDEWFVPLADWVHQTFDVAVVPVGWDIVERYGLPLGGVLTGKAGDSDHAVVINEGEFYWNPAGVLYGPLDEGETLFTFTNLWIPCAHKFEETEET